MCWKLRILLALCLFNLGLLSSSVLDAARAGEVGGSERKLSDGPVEFKVEENKAEQKLVFKLGLPAGSPPQFVDNALKTIKTTFHQWGLAVEKACRDLDRLFRTNDGTGRAIPIPTRTAPPAVNSSSSTQAGAKFYWTRDGRVKAIAER